MNENQVLLMHSEESKYMSDKIFDQLIEKNYPISRLNIIRTIEKGDKLLRFEIPSPFYLLGKAAVYISSLTNDDAFIEIERINFALSHSGVYKKLFIIPYLGYSSSYRSIRSGEIVTCKTNNQMLSSLGSTDENTFFLFFDLHEPAILHYFEGSCIRAEIEGKNILSNTITKFIDDPEKLVFGSIHLYHSKWVNSYASMFHCPIALASGKFEQQSKCFGCVKLINEIYGNVKSKHVVVFDDLILSGSSMVTAVDAYIKAGADKVDLLASHIGIFDFDEIKALNSSQFNKIIVTNSHPITQTPIIQDSPKFVVVDISTEFVDAIISITKI